MKQLDIRLVRSPRNHLYIAKLTEATSRIAKLELAQSVPTSVAKADTATGPRKYLQHQVISHSHLSHVEVTFSVSLYATVKKLFVVQL